MSEILELWPEIRLPVLLWAGAFVATMIIWSLCERRDRKRWRDRR